MKVGWRVGALLLLCGVTYFSYFPLAACVTKPPKTSAESPVVIFNLRHDFPSRELGPIRYAIHIYSEGVVQVTHHNHDGVVSVERTASNEKIDKLLDLFRREKIMELSDTKIVEGVIREYKRRTGHEPGVFSVTAHRPGWSELIIQHPTLGTNKFLWHGLNGWLSCNPDVKELEALDACIAKVYETAGEQRK